MAEQPMDADEFDDYMDGLTIREQNHVSGYKIDISKNEKSPADKFNEKLVRLILWLILIACWAWLIFTFGWPATLLVMWLNKQLAKGKKEKNEGN